MIYKCNICPAEFKTQRGLDNHKHRWYCPECGAKLTTLKGYERHVARHSESVSKKAAAKAEKERLLAIERQEREDQFRKKVELLKERGLFNPKYKAGDKVILSTYRVTKPTREKRWNRMVRVRYEEERYYYAQEFTVKCYIEPNSYDTYTVEKCLRENEQYPVLYATDSGIATEYFREKDVFTDMTAAKSDAAANGKAYKEACDFASMCR